jgi:hypothetical protein
MPSNKSFPAILHIRDFIEHVEPDPTRPGKGLSMQLRVSLNISDKDVQSDDVEQDDIPTLIRIFNEATDLSYTNQMLLSMHGALSSPTPLIVRTSISFFMLAASTG